MKQTISKRLIVINLAVLSTIAGVVFMSGASYAAAPKPPKVYQATCTITNVPSTLALGSTMKPELTVTNTGNATISPHMITPIATPGTTTYLKEKYVGSVAPGESKTVNLGKFTPTNNYALGDSGILSHSDVNYPSTHAYFWCVTYFTLVQ